MLQSQEEYILKLIILDLLEVLFLFSSISIKWKKKKNKPKLDSNTRRGVITSAMSLIRATRGKNIIISSNALYAMELRGPYDIINLY